MEKCILCGDWLNKIDKNYKKVKEYKEKFSDEEMSCTICSRRFNIVYGFAAINQHATTEKHKTECKQKLTPVQQKLQIV